MSDFDDDPLIGEPNPSGEDSGRGDSIIPRTGRFHSLFRSQTHHIISVVNQKGGCGKTTTAINLAASLADGGYKVLLVDTDPQAQASLGLGLDPDRLDRSLYDVLLARAEISQILQPTAIDNLFVVPAQSNLSGAQLELASVVGRETVLKSALDIFLQNTQFDFVIIDCSPTLNLVTINALTASHSVLVPFQTHYFSLEGMKELFHTIDTVKDRLNPTLKVQGIVVTLFDKRLKISHEIYRQVHEYFGELLFSTKIHINVKLCEAPMHKQSVITYAPKCQGTKDYKALAGEVIMRCHSISDPSRSLVEQPLFIK